jgi:DNA-binding SARP family transcriptional activator/tetratricopeptide (TPR) repeat protein
LLDIQLLGPPVVSVNGAPIEVDTRKAIAMLAYLVIEGAVNREALSGLFWGDSSPDRSRATLRRTLSALRAGVGSEGIRADRNRVELSPGYVCDVDRFMAAIAEIADHDHNADEVCDRCVEPLSSAAALYRGDFLGSFSVRDAPDFEDWARAVTESYRLKAGDVFQRLAMSLASTGDYTRAIDTATRWIDLDELHEPAHRLLMLLHAWAGDRPGAIRAYRGCVAVLDRELGVAPLEETTELFEAILDEDLPPAPALRRILRPAKTVPTPVVNQMLDRAEPLATLDAALESGRDQGRLCLITGDSWMGKTHLLEHLTVQGANEGYAAVLSRAYRAETMLPYGVAVQLLQPLARLIGGDDLPPWALDELGRLDPKLATGEVSSSAETLGPLRLREAFLTLISAASASQPILLMIDDAQWIDTASAEFLAYMLRRVEDFRGLIVISAREENMLHPALREMARTADNRIHLTPLTVDDIPSGLAGLDLQEVMDATGGIPLLVQESLDSGTVAPDSANVIRYMESRQERLSDLARQVMAAAAVLDGMCDASLLRDTSGRTDDEIVDAVEELVNAGLIREESDGHLGFTLDVLESVTYQATSLIRRRLLHRRAAETLEALPRSRTDARLATATANHLRAAGSDRAAEWFNRSGDLTRAIFANDEAAMSYETAIALGHPDVGTLRLALGELAMARGDYHTATRELRAAAAQSTGPALALVEHRIGELNRILGRFELAEESFSRAEADHPEPADLFADWALLRHRKGDTESAVTFAKRALDAAEAKRDVVLIARAFNILAVVTPDPVEAMGHVDKALENAGSAKAARMAALNNKAHLLAGSQKFDDAIELVTEAKTIAERAGYRHHQAALLNHLADLNHQLGREREAAKCLTEAVTLFADIDSGDWEPELWLLRQW